MANGEVREPELGAAVDEELGAGEGVHGEPELGIDNKLGENVDEEVGVDEGEGDEANVLTDFNGTDVEQGIQPVFWY